MTPLVLVDMSISKRMDLIHYSQSSAKFATPLAIGVSVRFQSSIYMFLIYDLICYSGWVTSPYPSNGDPGGPRYTHQNYSGRPGSSLGPILIDSVDVQSEINKQRFCTIIQNRQKLSISRPRTPPVPKITPK